MGPFVFLAKRSPFQGVGGITKSDVRRSLAKYRLYLLAVSKYMVHGVLDKPRQNQVTGMGETIRMQRIVHHLLVSVEAKIGEDHFFLFRTAEVVHHTIRVCLRMELCAKPCI